MVTIIELIEILNRVIEEDPQAAKCIVLLGGRGALSMATYVPDGPEDSDEEAMEFVMLDPEDAE
jgi:hypothetical protein